MARFLRSKTGYAGKARRVGKRRYALKPWRKLGLSLGKFNITRRVPLSNIVGSGAAGVAITNNVPLIKLGTPTAAQSGVTGYYDVPFGLEFHLNDLQQWQELTAIADKYQIKRADIILQTMTNVSNQGATLPVFVEYVHDYDDSAPADALELCAKMGLKNKGFNSRGQLKIRTWPKVAQQIYQSAVATAYAIPKGGIYLNSTYNSVPHYGLKGIIRNMLLGPSTSAVNAVTFDVKLTVTCKDLQ